MYLIIFSAILIMSGNFAKATSGSICQNSAACLGVLLFSALKVGPNVYIFPIAIAATSPSSCPLTVSPAFLLKKSFCMYSASSLEAFEEIKS